MRNDSFSVSSFCSSGGCLGVRIADDSVTMKDISAEDPVELHVSREEWAAFLAGVKNGDFDLDD